MHGRWYVPTHSWEASKLPPCHKQEPEDKGRSDLGVNHPLRSPKSIWIRHWQQWWQKDWPCVLMWSLSSLSVAKRLEQWEHWNLWPTARTENKDYMIKEQKPKKSCNYCDWDRFLGGIQPSMSFWRMMWSNSLVLLAYIPPQPGQATTFSWVWLRRCSRSLARPLVVASQSVKRENVKFFF